MLPKIIMICVTTNYILTKSYSDLFIPLSQVNKNQTIQFLTHNLKFYKKKQKPLIIEYKNVYYKDDFTNYFKNYKDI